MALTASLGALSLVTQSATQQTRASTLGSLAACAARIVKGQDNSQVISTARIGVQRALKNANMRAFFEFARKEASDVNLTADTDTYALQSDFYAISGVQLINTDGDEAYTLEFIPWQKFNVEYQTQTSEGRPKFWTYNNAFSDEQIVVYPVPDSSAATDWDLRIGYYTRVSVPTQDSDAIVAPQELDEPLCLFSEAYVLEVHGGPNDPNPLAKKAEARESLMKFIGRHRSQPGNFGARMVTPVDQNRSSYYRGGRTRTIYIKSS